MHDFSRSFYFWLKYFFEDKQCYFAEVTIGNGLQLSSAFAVSIIKFTAVQLD